MSKPELITEKYLPPSCRDWEKSETLEWLLFWLYNEKKLDLKTKIDHKNQFLRFSYCYGEEADLYGKPVILLRVHIMNIEAMNFPEQKEEVKTILLQGKLPLEVVDSKLMRGFFFAYKLPI